MALSHLKASKAVAADKPYKLTDGEGLYLLVNPNGSKLWRLNYREDGKQKTASFGPFPRIGLLEARACRDELKLRLRSGLRSFSGGPVPSFKVIALRCYSTFA